MPLADFITNSFRVLGVAKCGTTSWSNYIASHPQVLPKTSVVGNRFEIGFAHPRATPVNMQGCLVSNPHAANWAYAASHHPSQVFGDGAPLLQYYVRGLWPPRVKPKPGKSIVKGRHARRFDTKALRNPYGKFKPVRIAELMHAIDAKV